MKEFLPALPEEVRPYAHQLLANLPEGEINLDEDEVVVGEIVFQDADHPAADKPTLVMQTSKARYELREGSTFKVQFRATMFKDQSAVEVLEGPPELVTGQGSEE